MGMGLQFPRMDRRNGGLWHGLGPGPGVGPVYRDRPCIGAQTRLSDSATSRISLGVSVRLPPLYEARAFSKSPWMRSRSLPLALSESIFIFNFCMAFPMSASN